MVTEEGGYCPLEPQSGANVGPVEAGVDDHVEPVDVVIDGPVGHREVDVLRRGVDGEVLDFGVSGKLYESNLLMFDRKTESLWSQSRGEAVVGDMLGTKLDIYPTNFLTFAQVREQFPGAEILSRDTGHDRNYDFDPYSGYGDNENTLFPISVRDERFSAKELFYVVPVGEHSVAIKLKDLTEGVVARVAVGDDELEVSADGGVLNARLNGEGESLPNYVEMWFSWATHHQEDGIIWSAGE